MAKIYAWARLSCLHNFQVVSQHRRWSSHGGVGFPLICRFFFLLILVVGFMDNKTILLSLAHCKFCHICAHDCHGLVQGHKLWLLGPHSTPISKPVGYIGHHLLISSNLWKFIISSSNQLINLIFKIFQSLTIWSSVMI